jgi:long-chain acyl-CoA synthetase
MTATTSRPTVQTPTVATRVRDRARTTPDAVAMREKLFGIWTEITWAEYWDAVCDVAHAFLSLGVQPGDRVAIHSENRPEWLFADLGTVAIRAITMGLYPTNPASEVAYLLGHSGAKILIAEDQEQVDKVLAVGDELPDLQTVVYIDPRGVRSYAAPRLLGWDAFIERGREHRRHHEGAIERLMAEARSDDIVTLIYTSGTTGPPKGAMLSVTNVEFAISVFVQGAGFVDPTPGEDDVILSYLPLCHVAERAFTEWFNAGSGVQINFAESIETVPANMREIRPTLLFGVPRIWEKIAAGVTIRAQSASPIKRWNFNFWMRVANWIGDRLVANGGSHTWQTRLVYAVGWLFLYRPLRERIGMSKVRYAASGAAPIAPEVLKFYMGLGVPMHELYGMTENTGVTSANRPGRVKLGTVGEPHQGADVRVDPETGEIQTRHPGNFAGYWRDEVATRATYTEDGWLKTGDVGEWVDGGYLRITDRMKDIIITAGGKNISPSEIENALKVSPFVKEALVIGDRRKYLTALIGIELDTIGDWAQRRGIPYTTYRDLTEKPEVLALVRDVVEAVNERFAQVEQVKKFRLLPKELDHEDGELTATQKVKRANLANQFDDLIADMYREQAP